MTAPDSPSDAQPSTGTYGNFSNPLGLVYRMLRSGKRSARAALFREGFRLILTPVDLVMSLIERRSLRNPPPRQHPMVLVVGPPRCGTTLVYQVLARYCDVSCLTNLSSLFPRAPLTASRWFGRPLDNVPPAIESYYGQTARLCDPNDGFHAWNRWLGDDRYQTAQDISAAAASEMNRFFAAWTSALPKPFLNKNNRNTECMRLLSENLADIFFVVVRRDLTASARSLIRSRLDIQGDRNTPWGLRSRQLKGNDDPLGYVDDVCDQLYEIESRIQRETSGIDSKQMIEVTYEKFCDDPKSVLQQLRQTVPGLQLRESLIADELQPFRRSLGKELSPAEEQRLSQSLKMSKPTQPTSST